MHILPTCSESYCLANGNYWNDDGLVLNITGNQNLYSFAYIHDLKNSPDQIRLQMTQVIPATNYNSSIVNLNDALNSLFIYNAAAMGMDKSSYWVKVFFAWDGGWKDFGATTYNIVTDRITFTNDRALFGEIYLPKA
mgnify:CR=1 FL=1